MNDPAFQIQHIGPVTFNIGQIPFYQLSQMMLGNDFNGKEIFENINVRDGFLPLSVSTF